MEQFEESNAIDLKGRSEAINNFVLCCIAHCRKENQGFSSILDLDCSGSTYLTDDGIACLLSSGAFPSLKRVRTAQFHYAKKA